MIKSDRKLNFTNNKIKTKRYEQFKKEKKEREEKEEKDEERNLQNGINSTTLFPIST